DLLRSVIDKLGAYVEKIVIDDLWNSTYYAKVFIEGDDDEPIEIDSRPSDAIAIAIRFNAPIYVSEGILDAAEDF
ncbi:MAG: bifunctional nuclease family protein, partial [Fimbriimonadaceae bacterium]